MKGDPRWFPLRPSRRPRVRRRVTLAALLAGLLSSPGDASENRYLAGSVCDCTAVIAFNSDGNWGADSAFFVHVSNGSATAGFVRSYPTTMVQLLPCEDLTKNPVDRDQDQVYRDGGVGQPIRTGTIFSGFG